MYGFSIQYRKFYCHHAPAVSPFFSLGRFPLQYRIFGLNKAPPPSLQTPVASVGKPKKIRAETNKRPERV